MSSFSAFVAWLAGYRDEQSDTGDIARAVDGDRTFASAETRPSGVAAYLLIVRGGDSEWSAFDRAWGRFVEHRRLAEISSAVHDNDRPRAAALLATATRVSPSLRVDLRVRKAVEEALRSGDVAAAARAFCGAVDLMERWRWSKRLPARPSLVRMSR